MGAGIWYISGNTNFVNQEDVVTRVEDALATFQCGFNCAQSVLAAFAGDLGIPRETALKIASGFGGGMGRMSLTCGAVTGAFMALGLKSGYSAGGDRASRENIYQMVREFSQQFHNMHGSIECRELLGFDISTPDGHKAAADNKLFRTQCPRFVRDAVEMIEKLLHL